MGTIGQCKRCEGAGVRVIAGPQVVTCARCGGSGRAGGAPGTMRSEYQALLPALQQVAYDHGYALAFHGSGQRDLDLVAVPWVEGAKPAPVLAEAMRAAVDGWVLPQDVDRNPAQKPHGRLAWSFYLPGFETGYIDLSVMPRKRRRA